jgi:hypothetical protein
MPKRVGPKQYLATSYFSGQVAIIEKILQEKEVERKTDLRLNLLVRCCSLGRKEIVGNEPITGN